MIGIDLGTRWFTASWIGRNRELVTCSKVDAPWDAVVPDLARTGDIRPRLKDLVRQGPRRKGDVVVAIPDGDVDIFFVELERFSDFTPEEREYTRWRVKSLLPSRYREGWIVTYQLLATIERDESRRFRLIVMASPEPLINDLARMLDGMGLRPLGFSPQFLASINAAHETLSLAQKPVMIIRLGSSGTSLAFIRSGVLQYHRYYRRGISHLVEGLAAGCQTPTGEVEAALEAGMLEGFGDGTRVPDWFCPEIGYERVLPYLKEVATTARHFREEQDMVEIGEAFLLGQGAQIPGVAQLLREVLGVRVRGYVSALRPHEAIPSGEEATFAASAGAALLSVLPTPTEP